MIQLRVLGPPVLERLTGERRRPVHLGPRRLALLAYLAVAGAERPVRRDTLLALFWPERSTDRARAALRQALYSLRSHLGESVVDARGDDELAVTGAVRCDACTFREAVRAGRWADAVAVYCGDFLEGFFARGAPEFERWMDQVRSNLRRDAAEAAWKAATTLGRHAPPARVARLAERAVSLAPHDEALARRAIELLDSIGNAPAAIALYERFAEGLREDYELDPSDETARLAAAIRAVRTRKSSPSQETERQAAWPIAADEARVAAGPPEAAPEPPARQLARGAPAKRSPRRPAAEDAAARRIRRIWRGFAAAGAASIGLGLAINFVVGGLAPSFDPPVTLAVLPLRELGDSRYPGFAEGLTDELRSRLAQNPRLRIAARARSEALSEADDPATEIARLLGAEFLLSGSIRWSADPGDPVRIRVTPSLVHVADGTEIWSDRYDALLEDAFAVQSRIAAAVTARLGLTLGGSPPAGPEVDTPPTADPLAYAHYLQGSHFLSREWVGRNLRLASQMLRKAVELDPAFALAWARLSMADSELYQAYWDRSDSVRASAGQAARRALELEPDLTEGLLARGLYHYRIEFDYAKSLRDLERVARRRPGDPHVLSVLAYLERRRGNWDRAVELHERALALDPHYASGRAGAMWTYVKMRRYADAERVILHALELFPDQRGFHGAAAMLYVIWQGDVARARSILDRASTELGFPRGGTTWLFLEMLGRRYDGALALLHEGIDPAAAHMWKGRLNRLLGREPLARAHFDSAAAEYRRRVRAAPNDPWQRSVLGLALAGAGHAPEGIAEAREAVALRPVERYAVDGPLYLERLARTLVYADEHDAAVDVLERLLSIPSEVSAPLLRVHPEYDPLRDHARFRDLVGGTPAIRPRLAR
ncbi:MAG TPA: BTAD domain-containing putative transcriptional regulator [Candidatus Limnocylindria bacterium]|nr:BTAD domain-containing putative transcriptional regulator [Candidatus Limnocylindria bacterium]